MDQFLKAMGIDNPESFAVSDATKWKNAYGSDISVKDDLGMNLEPKLSDVGCVFKISA